AGEEELRELGRALAHRLEVLQTGAAALGRPRAERGRDERLEQAGLAVGRRAERAQVARRDPEARERLARLGDLGVRVGVDALPALDAWLEQPEVLELARPGRLDPRAGAELLEVEPRLRLAERRPPPPALAACARGELLADHAQRQELVALEEQDRLEPVDVVLGEEPVAALRPLRRQEPLVLEVADLRDRDVRELGLQPPADRADRQELLAAGGRRHQRVRNVSLYLPIWSSSPSESSAESTRFRFTKVPFRLPWSSTNQRPSRCSSSACLRETVTSSRKIPQSGERPIVVCPLCGANVSLERPVVLGGLERLRLLDALALPLVEERAALRAVVRGLRVLEAALRTVDVAHQALGGAAFPARISVSDSTSTWSRTLRPSVFCRRATSSARRMSILPCRIRRRYETSCSSFVYSSIRCFRSSSDMFARSGSGSTGTFRSEGQARL